MAMEWAIMELAAGMKELAAAMRSAGVLRTVEAPAELGGAPQSTETQVGTVTLSPARAAIQAALDAAKQGSKKDEDNAAGVVQAVSDYIEQKGTVLPDDTAANVAEVEKQNAAVDLDYAKDVRPVLLAAIKKAGKDAVAAMIGKYGVDKADKLEPEQLPAVLAQARKLIAEADAKAAA